MWIKLVNPCKTLSTCYRINTYVLSIIFCERLQGKENNWTYYRPSALLCFLYKLCLWILPTTLQSRTTLPTLQVTKLRLKDDKQLRSYTPGKRQRKDLYPDSSDSTFLCSQTALQIFKKNAMNSKQQRNMVWLRTRTRPNRPTMFVECLSHVRSHSGSLPPWNLYPAKGKETINK